MQVPFFSLTEIHQPLKDKFLEAAALIFDSNGFILGKELQSFEANFAKFCSTRYSIGVGNGLDALKIALKTLDIGVGDEVIVPAHTYIATWLAVTEVGAIPIAVDAFDDTMNIDVNQIEAKITPKTKAIMPVHIYGQMCDMESIMNLAKKYNLYVVEDFAQSQGATFKGKFAGSFGHINGTSFYPGKNIGALGDAGAITTNNEILAEKARKLRSYGSLIKYQHEIAGVNSRLDTLQAAFLDIKLQNLNEWNKERNRLAKIYFERLESIEELKMQTVHKNAFSVYHLFVLRIKKRDELQKYLQEKGVGTLIHYPIPPHLQPAYLHLNLPKNTYLVAEKIAKTALSLPLFPGLTDEQVNYVCDCIFEFFDQTSLN
jgi:dTDP-4-amino-4,6-dideoxygalactose transaminase